MPEVANEVLVTRTIYGLKARFHDDDCAESFKEDRRHGLIYGTVLLDDGRVVGWEQGSIEADFCAYCG